jgi:hypothetical protein
MFCENNIAYLITAIAVLFWFKGMYRVLDKYIPDNMTNNVILIFLSLSLLFFNEGTLKTLGSSNKVPVQHNETHKPNGHYIKK